MPISESTCRLLYIAGQLSAGGAERQLNYLVQMLHAQGLSPHVVVWNYKESDLYASQLREAGVPVHPLRHQDSNLKKMAFVRGLVRTLRPEVVHSYTYFTNLAAWWSAIGTSAVPVGSIRCDFLEERWRSGKILGRLNARFPRTLIANSAAAQRSATACTGLFRPQQVLMVRNGMALDRFAPAPLPSGPASLLGIGRLEPRKRWDIVIGAVAELVEKGLDIRARIVGEGPYGDRLREMAAAKGVLDRVEFLGHRKDIPALLADCTMLVHAADSEGTPNVVMEAMACGRAVVATDAGDVPELVADGVTGYVVPRGDGSTFTSRTEQILSDAALCARMGAAGRLRAEQEFGLDRLVSQVCAAYRLAGWSAAGSSTGASAVPDVN